MMTYRPSFREGGVYLENTKELVMVVDGGGVSDRTVIK